MLTGYLLISIYADGKGELFSFCFINPLHHAHSHPDILTEYSLPWPPIITYGYLRSFRCWWLSVIANWIHSWYMEFVRTEQISWAVLAEQAIWRRLSPLFTLFIVTLEWNPGRHRSEIATKNMLLLHELASLFVDANDMAQVDRHRLFCYDTFPLCSHLLSSPYAYPFNCILYSWKLMWFAKERFISQFNLFVHCILKNMTILIAISWLSDCFDLIFTVQWM